MPAMTWLAPVPRAACSSCPKPYVEALRGSRRSAGISVKPLAEARSTMAGEPIRRLHRISERSLDIGGPVVAVESADERFDGTVAAVRHGNLEHEGFGKGVTNAKGHGRRGLRGGERTLESVGGDYDFHECAAPEWRRRWARSAVGAKEATRTRKSASGCATKRAQEPTQASPPPGQLSRCHGK